MAKSSREQQRARARAEREAAERAAAAADLRRRRLTQLGGVLAAAAAIVVIVVLIVGGGGSNDGSKVTQAAGDRVAGETAIAQQLDGIPQRADMLGDPKAPVTIVEYGDLQCPACAAFSNQLLPTVVNDYVRTGKARLQFRHFPFLGPDSDRLAQMAAAATQQDKLFGFIELVYANQGPENSGYATDAFLHTIGDAAGLDVARAMAARTGPKAAALLAKDAAEARAAGVDSTPTLLVGRTGGSLERVSPPDLLAKLQQLES